MCISCHPPPHIKSVGKKSKWEGRREAIYTLSSFTSVFFWFFPFSLSIWSRDFNFPFPWNWTFLWNKIEGIYFLYTLDNIGHKKGLGERAFGFSLILFHHQNERHVSPCLPRLWGQDVWMNIQHSLLHEGREVPLRTLESLNKQKVFEQSISVYWKHVKQFIFFVVVSISLALHWNSEIWYEYCYPIRPGIIRFMSIIHVLFTSHNVTFPTSLTIFYDEPLIRRYCILECHNLPIFWWQYVG